MPAALTFIEPLAFFRQIGPTGTDTARVPSVWCIVEPDGVSTTVIINHKLNINATDLAAGYPIVEIVNPNNSLTSPYVPTLSTHTTLTGAPSQLGVTVSTSLASTLVLAIATPLVAQGNPGGYAFMVVLSRNPATPIPAP